MLKMPTAARTYPEEVTLVLLDLFTDILIKEQLAQDQRTHGLHIKPFSLSQDLFICSVNRATVLLFLKSRNKKIGAE